MAINLSSQTKPKLTRIVSIIALLIFMPILLYGTTEIASLLTRATGTPANIVVNTKLKLETLNLNFYHAFAQGGETSGNMLKPVAGQLAALKPRLVRIDHIYDLYNVVGKSGDQLTFNWTQLDDVVNTILATGAKPVLALSYMPSVIAKDGNIVNPPNDWNDWSKAVQRTIEHFSGRSGKNINGVYYEVWNEPDLGQFGGWRYYGDKNYITLYQYASSGARSAQGVNTFYLGGPATTGLYKEWINALINSGSRIDFLSWHSYQVDPTKYATDQQNIISWLLPYPQYTLIPKLITEFGFTGDKSTLYGSTYAAAHTSAVIRQLISGGPTYAFSFQPVDGPNQQAGDGWGLITNSDNGSKAKPRYYIYSFIDSCAGQRLSLSGEGSWVTGFASVNNNKICVMLTNFDANGTHSEAVPVTFDKLDPGNYTFCQQPFLGKNTCLTETVTGTAFQYSVLMNPSRVMKLTFEAAPAKP